MSGQFQLVTPTHTTIGKHGIIIEYVLETKDTVELEKYITLAMCVLTLNLRVAVRSLLEAFFAFILFLN